MSTEFFASHLHSHSKDNLQIELKINFQTLAQEIIKHLRSTVSQRDLSQKLGFSFNQVGKWENGTTLIKWDDFIHVCEAMNIPFEKHFRYAFWNQSTDFNSNTTLIAIIEKLNLLNDENSKNRSVLKKWHHGDITPALSDVLKLIGLKSPTLFGWLSLFIDCSKIDSLKKHYEIFLKTIDIVLSDPITVYVNAALQTEAYKKLELHNDALLAEHSACSIIQTKQALQTLSTYNLIYFDGKKYHPSFFDFSFSGLRHPKLRALTSHTTKLAAERYSSTPVTSTPTSIYNASQSSVRISALSADAAKKVVDLIVQFHNQVDAVVKNDHHPKDNVQVILIHSFASNINSPKITD